jgi:hypothetical protein
VVGIGFLRGIIGPFEVQAGGEWSLFYMPQLKICWQSRQADKMGQWKAFWNLLGFTQTVKAKVDFFLNAAADVSG